MQCLCLQIGFAKGAKPGTLSIRKSFLAADVGAVQDADTWLGPPEQALERLVTTRFRTQPTFFLWYSVRRNFPEKYLFHLTLLLHPHRL